MTARILSDADHSTVADLVNNGNFGLAVHHVLCQHENLSAEEAIAVVDEVRETND